MGTKTKTEMWPVDKVAAWIQQVTGRPTSDQVARRRMKEVGLEPTYELVDSRRRALWNSTQVIEKIPKPTRQEAARARQGAWRKLEKKARWTSAELAEWLTGYNGRETAPAVARSRMAQLGVTSVGYEQSATNRPVAMWDSADVIEKVKAAPGQGGPGKSRPART